MNQVAIPRGNSLSEIRKMRIDPAAGSNSFPNVVNANPCHFRLSVSDPEQFAEAIRGARLEARLLARTSGVSQLERIHLPRTCFDTARISSPLLFSGEVAEDCFTLIFVTACPRDGHSFNFSTRHGTGYIALFQPRAVLDAMTSAGYANATLTVPEKLFREEIHHRFPEIPDEWLKRGAGLRIPDSANRKLAFLLDDRREMDQSNSTWLADSMARVRFEEDLLEVFIDALREAHLARTPPQSPLRLRRYEAVRRIRDHIADHRGSPLRINDLCQVSGMSRRGVEYAFRDLFGVAANTFVRGHRLHGVRRSLLASEPAPGRIKQVALEWGFWHLGRFSADYCKLFGELPNATMISRKMANGRI